MTRPDASLLTAAVDWRADHAQVMSEVGVESRALGPTTDLSKNSATIELISSRLLVAVTIWDSGECEVVEASTEPEQEPEVQVLKLADVAEVRALLDRLERELTRKA